MIDDAGAKTLTKAAGATIQPGSTVKTAYLDEFCYRLNRHDQRLDLFRRILNRCVLYTPPTTYSQLITA